MFASGRFFLRGTLSGLAAAYLRLAKPQDTTATMYFWRIERLKEELSLRALSDREVLPYLLAYVGLAAVAGSFPLYSTFDVWEASVSTFNVLLAIFGSIYIYRQNGGAGGQHFLQRYFAVGWVVTVRWFTVFLVIMIGYMLTLEVFGGWQETTSWYEALFFALTELTLYWRIGFHVRDVAQRTA